VQKAGANVVVVGSLGATGTLIMNGGQLLNNNEFWLGESPTAVANLFLNGGLLQATDIRPNNNGGLPTVTPIASFNGGTLQATASSTNFLQVQCNVMSNGFVLDDNGFTLSIGGAALLAGDANGGGVTKLGSGKVYLDVANTYTGTTVVSNGLLAGIGSISGPVVVRSAGSIGAGDADATGSLTLSSTALTIQGKAALRISKTGGISTSDLITGISTVTYGGLLVISNATSDATALANGDMFTLFSAAANSGNFAGIVGTPGPGLAYSFNPTTGVLSVVTSSGPPPAPTFGKVLLSAGNIIITATNNNGPGGTYALLATNNIAAPLTNWPVISTGTFDSNGNLALTNAVGPGRLFYDLRVP
jgi:autotransporter-associated beta strand protein